MDDESGESTEEDEIADVKRGESRLDRLIPWYEVAGKKPGVDRRDKMWHIERNDCR